jgi:hypothetical protein
MKRLRNIKTILRFLGVVACLLIAVSGVTFAALQSQAVKLTGNSIETATANLLISTDGTNFSTAQPGFDFANIVPGGQPQSGYFFTLKNGGATPLALKFAVSSTPSNPANVDLSKISIRLTPTGGVAQSFSLASLIAANSSGGLAITNPSELFVGNRITFTIDVSMAADAMTGPSASIGNIDLAFTGLAVN